MVFAAQLWSGGHVVSSEQSRLGYYDIMDLYRSSVVLKLSVVYKHLWDPGGSVAVLPDALQTQIG